MLATPSWGEEKGISIKNIIDELKDTLWSFYQLKITLDLIVFCLMFFFFLALAVWFFQVYLWIAGKVSDIFHKKFEPKDDSSKAHVFFYIIVGIFIKIIWLALVILYFIFGWYFWLIVFFEAFEYTGFDLTQYRDL